jgi:hypothetical protein
MIVTKRQHNLHRFDDSAADSMQIGFFSGDKYSKDAEAGRHAYPHAETSIRNT